MFDSTPSNLPLEPMPESKTPGTPASNPTVAASAAPVAPPAPSSPSLKGRKEPEDIFADIDRPESVSRPMTTTPPAPHRGSRLRGAIITLVMLLALGGAGYAAWTFLIQPAFFPPVSPPAVVTTTPSAPIVETPPAPEPSPPAVTTPPPVPTATEPVTTPPPGTNIPIPGTVAPIAAVEATDSDADGLSDVEESLFGTNAMTADSDNDGFPDGAEVLNGYDPATPRAVLSSSVHLRTATVGTDWSVLLPVAWTLGTDAVPGDYAVQTGSPATFAFHFGVTNPSQPFSDWLRQNEPTVDAAAFRSFQTKQGNAAWQSVDQMTTYITDGTRIVRIRYQLNGAPTYDFRAIYNLMVEWALAI